MCFSRSQRWYWRGLWYHHRLWKVSVNLQQHTRDIQYVTVINYFKDAKQSYKPDLYLRKMSNRNYQWEQWKFGWEIFYWSILKTLIFWSCKMVGHYRKQVSHRGHTGNWSTFNFGRSHEQMPWNYWLWRGHSNRMASRKSITIWNT